MNRRLVSSFASVLEANSVAEGAAPLALASTVAVLVRRSLPDDIRKEAEQFAETDASPVRAESLESFEIGLSASPVGSALANDVMRLTKPFDEAFPQPRGIVAELFVTREDECRKFHVDNYCCRLLCTYVGPGTELVPSEAAREDFLSSGGEDAELANRQIVSDPSRVIHAGRADAVLLKGTRWPTVHHTAAIHRSPPIRSDGAVRVVLRVTAR